MKYIGAFLIIATGVTIAIYSPTDYFRLCIGLAITGWGLNELGYVIEE